MILNNATAIGQPNAKLFQTRTNSTAVAVVARNHNHFVTRFLSALDLDNAPRTVRLAFTITTKVIVALL
jgi:hypothetical protein